MRVIIDVADSDEDVIAGSRENGGQVTVITASRFCHGKVVGAAVPISVAGRGDRFKALYDITLLEGMTGS